MAHKSKTNHKADRNDQPRAAGKALDPEALRREVELRAYHRYCERGCAAGADVDDWVAAEREVLATHCQPSDAKVSGG